MILNETLPAQNFRIKNANTNRVHDFILRACESNAWLAEAEKRIPLDSPLEWKNHLQEGVANEGFQAATVELQDGTEKGILVFKVEEGTARELCIVTYYATRTAGLPMIELVEGVSEYLAKKYECVSIRFHTVRSGLVRHALKRGYHVSEIVMRKTVE